MAQTLVTIPNTRAYHLPTPGSPPIPVADGTLVLSVIPASPPAHPERTITLSVGHATFPLTHATPVVKTETNAEHPAFAFKPSLPAEGDTDAQVRVGKVKITLPASHGPSEYERTETLASDLERQLRELGCWKDQDYYDLEDADADAEAPAGYGTIADTLTSYGKWLAARIEALTESHAQPTTPTNTNTTVPQQGGNPPTESANNTGSSTIAAYAHAATETIGGAVHGGARYLGGLAGGAVKAVQEAVRTHPSDGGETVPSAVRTAGAGRSVGEVGEGWDEVKLSESGAAIG